TEEAILNMVNCLYKETGLKKLCIAGGVALNSVANGRVLKETQFEELYIQPQAGDGGGALGAALHTYHSLLGKERSFVMGHAFWGKEYSFGEIKEFLDKNNIPYEYIEDDEKLFERIVGYLQNDRVVGWFQGRFEWGPRALGNRSILADPRKAKMKDIVNIKIKFREPFRPFAPSVLVEETNKYFDLSNPSLHYPARFMLYVVDVLEDKRDIIPAITHVDGTGRLQTVFKETNPRYYRLIEKFKRATGIPLVLNTSFNLKGEPIVNTPENAFNTFSKSGMDVLVLEKFIVRKNEDN
ncbi:MAG: carbamoyltransferase C-terminal domain-containing protein, partial [bacterium]